MKPDEKYIKHLISILTFSFFIALQAVYSQPSAPLNSSEILLGLEKLNTVGSVLYIAAHPDDENTRLLAWLSREKKLRTAYLSVTRGDGGQNLIGNEKGDALGLIRTQELLAARRADGAEQYFTRAVDFGYSKNPEETFSHWNKDSILSDMVWVIRKFKPDVIICRFPTTGEGGHGHHTASAILAAEAFSAAADPTRFPEQLAFVQVWKTRRLFWNTFNFGSTNTTSPDQLQVDIGAYNPLLGKSYGEIAAESRSNHKSQGFGSASSRGTQIEYFKLIKGDSAKKDLFEGIDQTWNRLSVLPGMYNQPFEIIQEKVNECIRKFKPLSPEFTLPALVEIYAQLLVLNSDAKKSPELGVKIKGIDSWIQTKFKETTTLLLACAGIWMEASASDFMGVPGGDFNLNLQVIKRNNCDAKLEKIFFPGPADTVCEVQLKTNNLYSFKHFGRLPADIAYSNSYWLNEKHGTDRYVIKDRMETGKAENRSKLNVVFQLSLKGQVLEIERPFIYKYTDPVQGEVYRPFEILPPATVNLSEKTYLFSGSGVKTIQILVHANANHVKGKLILKAPEGWEIEQKTTDFDLAGKGDEVTLEANLSAKNTSATGDLMASLSIDGKIYSKSIQRIEYNHIPYQFILSDAEAKLVRLDLKTAGTTIAYIPGSGDELPACLKEIGYKVAILTDDQLAHSDLSEYSAILTGVRAYNTNKKLEFVYNRLMEYVKNGGNLIVQYNTNNNIGPLKSKIGPYPFSIGRERVTDENAKVNMLQPENPAFNFPNKIAAIDFDGWIQERGIYFATDIDKNYEKLISMNDPGEKPNDGSLITTKYGKGNFVYTGLVFFRELPAGIPGAYRLLVNLLSLPQNKLNEQ